MFLTKYSEYNHPSFLIIPFQLEHINKNNIINNRYQFDLKKLLQDRYPYKYVTITSGGRKALELALDYYRIDGDQNVLIQTTSDNFYISGCVTRTIEKKNKWHRNSQKKSDIILANHEFGYADNRLLNKGYRNMIEDCAFAFSSRFENEKYCGTIAECSIFSFSKFFPIQLGGFLLSDKPIEYKEEPYIEKYVNNVVGFYFNKIEEWEMKRLAVFNYYKQVFDQLNCKNYFSGSEYNIPGVFIFRLPEGIDTSALKKYYLKRGIQCSVFYGDQAFYLPLHQFTEKWHIDFFAELLFNFINEKYE